jgi:transketolase
LVSADPQAIVPALKDVATRLRIESIRATTAAGSGHPSSCCSAADLVAALFFAEMRFDPGQPRDPDNDRFVLSKGHAAPLLYAAWAEAGFIPRAELLTLRRIDSDLEGHPTPRLPFVDVATGSLGQGICAAVGIALNARRIGSPHRTYTLIGDGESAEGSVWEAADVARYYALSNLCGITDVNLLGQSQATQWGHDMTQFARRWEAFGWRAVVIDGHDMSAILGAFEAARQTTDRPTMILAKTIKGKGVPLMEGRPGWHGKPLDSDEADRAVAELQAQLSGGGRGQPAPSVQPAPKPSVPPQAAPPGELGPPEYELGAPVATREAYGTALARLGEVEPRVVVLDADVKNSTFSEKFEKVFAGRFYETFIAEQAMVGVAMGLASRGALAFPSTFACFLTRAYDFIRMAAISRLNVKLAGSHAGVSIGEDGPSQMGLEDLAMMRALPGVAVVYPADAVATERLVVEMARHDGPVYMRTSRPKTPVIYARDERFPLGGCKVLRQSRSDAVTVVGAGVTLFEALKAYDQLKAEGITIRVVDLYSIQPIDEATLRSSAAATNGKIVTIEDHFAGGGIGDAVAAATSGVAAVRKLAVTEFARSGKPAELLDRCGISARHVVAAVKAVMQDNPSL